MRMQAKRTRRCARNSTPTATGFAEKPEIVALNKADAVTPDELKRQAARVKRAAGKAPLILSGATGQGVPDALRALAAVIDQARAAPTEASEAAVWRS